MFTGMFWCERGVREWKRSTTMVPTSKLASTSRTGRRLNYVELFWESCRDGCEMPVESGVYFDKRHSSVTHRVKVNIRIAYCENDSTEKIFFTRTSSPQKPRRNPNQTCIYNLPTRGYDWEAMFNGILRWWILFLHFQCEMQFFDNSEYRRPVNTPRFDALHCDLGNLPSSF